MPLHYSGLCTFPDFRRWRSGFGRHGGPVLLVGGQGRRLGRQGSTGRSSRRAGQSTAAAREGSGENVKNICQPIRCFHRNAPANRLLNCCKKTGYCFCVNQSDFSTGERKPISCWNELKKHRLLLPCWPIRCLHSIAPANQLLNCCKIPVIAFVSNDQIFSLLVYFLFLSTWPSDKRLFHVN